MTATDEDIEGEFAKCNVSERGSGATDKVEALSAFEGRDSRRRTQLARPISLLSLPVPIGLDPRRPAPYHK